MEEAEGSGLSLKAEQMTKKMSRQCVLMYDIVNPRMISEVTSYHESDCRNTGSAFDTKRVAISFHM